jgi:hypothetical protein
MLSIDEWSLQPCTIVTSLIIGLRNLPNPIIESTSLTQTIHFFQIFEPRETPLYLFHVVSK